MPRTWCVHLSYRPTKNIPWLHDRTVVRSGAESGLLSLWLCGESLGDFLFAPMYFLGEVTLLHRTPRYKTHHGVARGQVVAQTGNRTTSLRSSLLSTNSFTLVM